jgi:hypothetical protein
LDGVREGERAAEKAKAQPEERTDGVFTSGATLKPGVEAAPSEGSNQKAAENARRLEHF